MILPVGDSRNQMLTLVVAGEDGCTRHVHEGCVFVKLIGEEGWSEPS